MIAALSDCAVWGYFDPSKSDYVGGYQCLPVNWGINADCRCQFVATLKEITGA